MKTTRMTVAGVCTAVAIVCGGFPSLAPKSATAAPAAQTPLKVEDVNAAQQAWCDALLSIAKAHATGGDYKSIAVSVLSNNYNYDYGIVLFNPTLTFGEQTFRLDKEGAAAYFIGGNPQYPNDDGFALKPWVGCRYTNAGDNAGVLIDGDFAATMGNVYLTDDKGAETIVDKLFVFRRGDDGKLRIIVHKSAIPNPVPK
jgi:hypothetical protein